MQTFQVEVWADGNDYEAGKDGKIIKIRANSPSHAETKSLRSREYEVAECVIFRNYSPSEAIHDQKRGMVRRV
jgi:hypothetical protein